MTLWLYCAKCGQLFDIEGVPLPCRCPKCNHAYADTLGERYRREIRPTTAQNWKPSTKEEKNQDWPEDRARVKAILKGELNE